MLSAFGDFAQYLGFRTNFCLTEGRHEKTLFVISTAPPIRSPPPTIVSRQPREIDGQWSDPSSSTLRDISFPNRGYDDENPRADEPCPVQPCLGRCKSMGVRLRPSSELERCRDRRTRSRRPGGASPPKGYAGLRQGGDAPREQLIPVEPWAKASASGTSALPGKRQTDHIFAAGWLGIAPALDEADQVVGHTTKRPARRPAAPNGWGVVGYPAMLQTCGALPARSSSA
jgi:hypothetical protein